MAFSDHSKIRNVIILGKTGSGKSTIINKILGKECVEARFSFSGVTQKIKQVSGQIQVEGITYKVNIIDTVGISDSKFKTKKENEKAVTGIKDAIKEKYTAGVNLLIVTMNITRIGEDDIEMFKMLENHFKAMFWKMCVLVFTHRDLIKRVAVQKKIVDFKDNAKSKDIASKFEDRIYTVGFPKIEDIKEEYKEELLKEMPIDVYRLRKVVANATDTEPPENIVSSKCVIL